MGFSVTLTEAAASLGISDQSSYMFSGAPGIWLSTYSSWGTGPLPIGHSGSIDVLYSSGYTIALTFTLNSSSSATLTEIALLSSQFVPLITYSGTIAVSPTTLVGSLSDSVVLAGDDSITGNSGNDRLEGYGGNDTINGGGGTDTAVFAGSHSSYSITQTSTGLTVSGVDGTDHLTSVERLQFDDGDVAFDLNATAGEAYRLYQAAFGRVPDVGGLGYQINDLDTRFSLEQVASNFIASPEFQSTYGNVDNTQFLTLLYNNVLHRAPDTGGLQFHLAEMAAGQSRAVELIHFSESPENQANVIGAIGNGIFYDPFTG
jgi:hypothetical protein